MTSAKPSRATCQVDTGTPSFNSVTQRLLHGEALVAERGEGSGRAGELSDQDARLEVFEAFGVAVEHGKPDRRLVAEGHRQRLLQMSPAGHRRVAVLLRQVGEDGAQARNVVADDRERVAHLQHYGRVHDVLRCRTPVHVAAGLAALLHQLVHDRQDRIADEVGLATQQLDIEFGGVGAPGDLVGGGLRNDADPRLGLGERDLDLDIARDQRGVGEDVAHRRGAEGVAEQKRVENGGSGHRGPLSLRGREIHISARAAQTGRHRTPEIGAGSIPPARSPPRPARPGRSGGAAAARRIRRASASAAA